MAFSTKINGNHHLQGNVQVYNVRIPDVPRKYFNDTVQAELWSEVLVQIRLQLGSTGIVLVGYWFRIGLDLVEYSALCNWDNLCL